MDVLYPLAVYLLQEHHFPSQPITIIARIMIIGRKKILKIVFVMMETGKKCDLYYLIDIHSNGNKPFLNEK